MANAENTLPLAGDSAPATRADWRRLVEAMLEGRPFARLESTTYDGARIEPLAERRSDARPIATRPGATPWQVLSRIDHPDPALANEAAREELANGAAGLSLVFAGGIGDYGFGLPASEEVLARVLEGVEASAGVAIELDPSPSAETAMRAALTEGGILSPLATAFRLGSDPLGAMAGAGGVQRPWNEAAPHFARRLSALARAGFGGQLAAADGRVIHNAGGSDAQELAFVLGAALAYLRALEAEGVALEAGRRMIFFRLSADADQFLTIAKFRAVRKLWTRVEVSCNLSPQPAFVSAETAWRMMTQRDAHVNILRATIATFAAALGGADAITVLPFTAARGLPDRFARRIARNTQLILIEETHLDKVADPAAGSGAIEDVTDQLCHAAWSLFREFEAAGGVAAALASGSIQQKVAAVRAKRAAAVARREEALTGVSIFPNLSEDPIIPRAAREDGLAQLPPMRLAAPFETLRDTSDRVLAQTGTRPKVFLASLGTPAEFTPRATFAKNFFESGGIESVSKSPDQAEIAAAYKTSGAALVCLCSSDKVYEREAAAAAAALAAAGARCVYLAGRPGGSESALRAAGVQSFIYEGCDALAALTGAYNILGIEIR